MHSHLSESVAEMAWVAALHPESGTYADVYRSHGLLHERSYMAHCVHCGDAETATLAAARSGVVHCPASNFMLKSGICDVRRFLDHGLKVLFELFDHTASSAI